MHRRLLGSIVVGVAALVSPWYAEAADPTAAAKERQLIGVLESDAPAAEKAITCKRLAIYGSAAAVPALGKLLPDPQLSSWARIPLEAIPDPAADKALRDALDTLDGRLLVGVIHSLGVRRDPAAVGGLTSRLSDADVDVASAAAVALGRIGGPAARSALGEALANGPAEIRSAVAEGCILSAERLLAEGQQQEAVRWYDTLRVADVPEQRRREAIRGAILARQSAGVPLLVEQLRSPDRERFGMGLRTARELKGAAVTRALSQELRRAAPARQRLLILAIAERQDEQVLPAILDVARNGERGVRSAAIEVLGRAGNASSVPTLLSIAAGSDAELASRAKGALAALPGDEVNRALAARLPGAQGSTRLALIELVGLRRIDAVPALKEAAAADDRQVRSAALAALGATIGPDDLGVLLERVVAPRHSDDVEPAQGALRAAATRMPDRDGVSRQLVAAMKEAPKNAQQALLETIGSVGGAVALRAVADAAEHEDPELQDTATELLGKWMTSDAAAPLLHLAKVSTDEKYRRRALRGYIRIARQFTLPAEVRAEMCRNALEAASRDAERQLVLQVLERHPSVDTLQLAVGAVQVPSLKSESVRVAMAIAQKIGGDSVDLAELLAQVGQPPVKLEIVKAEYGAGDRYQDVTDVLRKHVRNIPLVVLPSPSYNASFGGDPSPGVKKELKVQYRLDDQLGRAVFAENAAIILQAP